MKYSAAVMFLGGLLGGVALAFAGSPLQVKDAWVPEAPPVAEVMAAYFEVENTGDKAVTITDVNCPDFGMVMMHKTVTQDGMSKMMHQDGVTVAAKSKVKFERGGLHLMLMNPKHAFKVGDSIPLTMQTSDKQTIQFNAIVKPASLGGDDHHQHQH